MSNFVAAMGGALMPLRALYSDVAAFLGLVAAFSGVAEVVAVSATFAVSAAEPDWPLTEQATANTRHRHATTHAST